MIKWRICKCYTCFYREGSGCRFGKYYSLSGGRLHYWEVCRHYTVDEGRLMSSLEAREQLRWRERV